MSLAKFKCRNMPVTLLRIGTKAPFTNSNWTRLQKHIARHEQAGGIAWVTRRHLDKPVEVEGYKCIEMADVELADADQFI